MTAVRGERPGGGGERSFGYQRRLHVAVLAILLVPLAGCGPKYDCSCEEYCAVMDRTCTMICDPSSYSCVSSCEEGDEEEDFVNCVCMLKDYPNAQVVWYACKQDQG